MNPNQAPELDAAGWELLLALREQPIDHESLWTAALRLAIDDARRGDLDARRWLLDEGLEVLRDLTGCSSRSARSMLEDELAAVEFRRKPRQAKPRPIELVGVPAPHRRAPRAAA